MKCATFKVQLPLLISLSLLIPTALSPVKVLANQEPSNAGAKKQDPSQISTDLQGKIDSLKRINSELDQKIRNIEYELDELSGPDINGFKLGPLHVVGSHPFGLVSLLLACFALIRVNKQRVEVNKLKGRYQKLLTRLDDLDVKFAQYIIAKRVHSTVASAPTTASIPMPSPIAQPLRSVAEPETKISSSKEPINKTILISALNTGDRQSLRAAANSEMNITNESENALAMGKAIATELEEVAGGGSYWHIVAQDQDWLFPTERTLSGFAVAQPSKGLFHYEQQTIAQPKLIEPALLEKSGSRWSIKSMGRIAIP